MLNKERKKSKSNLIKTLLLRYKVKRLEKKYSYQVKANTPKDNNKIFNKKNKEVDYNKSLLMPFYRDDVVEAIAKRKVSPKIVNNLIIKKHKYGEIKEKNYKFAMAKVEVMEDVCRINNWTTRKEMDEHKVPVAKLFKELYKVAVEYSDILRYYAKLHFEQRREESS